MKRISLQHYLFLFFIFLLLSCGKKQPVKIAFLGDSITIGSGLKDKEKECYPAVFAKLLEANYNHRYLVKNFAVSGRTLLRKGDYPLWNESQFQKSLEFAPDIVYIMLGTNDSKSQNWDVSGYEFQTDYQTMIDTFRTINPSVEFILAYPPPAFSERFGIRDSVILNGIIPSVRQMVMQNHTFSIDFHQSLLKDAHLFRDDIHPNEEGATVMADLLYKKMINSKLIN